MIIINAFQRFAREVLCEVGSWLLQPPLSFAWSPPLTSNSLLSPLHPSLPSSSLPPPFSSLPSSPSLPFQLYKHKRYYPYYQLVIPAWYSDESWKERRVAGFNYTSEWVCVWVHGCLYVCTHVHPFNTSCTLVSETICNWGWRQKLPAGNILHSPSVVKLLFAE